MYVLGHVALANLPLAAYLAMARKRLEPGVFLALLFFANMQDALHATEMARDLSHNLLGTALMFAGVFLLFERVGLVGRRDAGITGFAVAVHAAGDVMFSGFNPLFPFADNPVTVWGFNSPEDVVAEAALSLLFVAAAYALGDWQRLRPYVAERVRKFYGLKWFPVRDAYYYPLYLYAVMLSISVIQFAIGLHYNLGFAAEGAWHSAAFLAAFAGFLAVFGHLAVPAARNA
jgi:hypothetical protein